MTFKTPCRTRLGSTLLLIPTAAVLMCVASPAFAASGDASWGGFLGRTHVLWLHLPIGLLVGAFVIESLGLLRRSRGFDVAAAWLFVLGFIFSIGAVWSGLLLGTEQASDKSLNALTLLFADADQGVGETLSRHMWLGVTLMLVAGGAAFLKVLAVKKQWKDGETKPQGGGATLMLARVSLVLCMVAMPFVGHLGGNMTHGQTYLTERVPDNGLGNAVVAAINTLNAGTTEEPAEEQSAPDGVEIQLVNGTAAFWNAKIQPAMNDHCIACHGTTKQNGKLRLDSLQWAMKGGSIAGEDNIIPDDYELMSEIYRRVILPPSHDEYMPTNVDKHGQLTQEEVHMLGEWLMAFDGTIEEAAASSSAPVEEEPAEPAKPVLDPAVIQAIANTGANAGPLAQGSSDLRVAFSYKDDLSPDAVAKLASAADHIAWLSFDGSSLDDAAVRALPDLPGLTQLSLKDTKITDAGVAVLPSLPTLEWLNLFGTAVTDNAIASLKTRTTLKKLYLTGTQVTADGVQALRQAMPNTQVFSDHDDAFQFSDAVKQASPAQEESGEFPAASAKPINATCPIAGTPVSTEFVSVYKGKTVAFCCGNCKKKFDENPEQFAGKLPQ